MEGESILQTTAEVSVALAGFTGVIAAFGQRGGRWTIINTLRFQVMLNASLAALFFSILPVAVHHMGAAPNITWAMSSGLLALYFVIMPSVDYRRARRIDALQGDQFRMWLFVVTCCVVVVAIVTQGMNALDIGFHRAFGPYLLGLCCVLLVCAFMFVRLLSFVGQQVAEE